MVRRGSSVALTIMVLLAPLVVQISTAQAATINVTRKDDPAPNGCSTGGCSLREAIDRANQQSTGDVIQLGSGTYHLKRAGTGEDANATGDLDIEHKVTIVGKGPSKTIIDANDIDRAFHVVLGATGVVLKNLTVRGGTVESSGTASPPTFDGGGGILNRGGLRLQNVVVAHNSSPLCCGGGIYSTGTLAVVDSRVHHNVAYECCGAGLFNAVGKATIKGSRFDHNWAHSCCGGAVWNSDAGDVIVSNSKFDNNHVPECCGGGLYSEDANSSLTVTNSRFVENTADDCCGAAIFNWETSRAIIKGSYFGQNYVDSCCGSALFHRDPGGLMRIERSVVEDNVSRVCCGAVFVGTQGEMEIVRTIVRRNRSPRGYAGGGVAVMQGSTATISDSLISSNRITGTRPAGADPADGTGGGVFVEGAPGTVANIIRSTISNNSASQFGGGVYVEGNGKLTLQNSTVSGNASGIEGGGIYEKGAATLDLSFVTITKNQADMAGDGILSDATNFVIANSIVAGNPGTNCSAILTGTGKNLDSDSSCFAGSGGLHGDPRLGKLKNNGGPTPTHALLKTSPAVDAVSTPCPPPARDQRGVGRPKNGDGQGNARCDLGAFELQP